MNFDAKCFVFLCLRWSFTSSALQLTRHSQLGSTAIVVVPSHGGVVAKAIIIIINFVDALLQDGYHIVERAQAVCVVLAASVGSVDGDHGVISVMGWYYVSFKATNNAPTTLD